MVASMATQCATDAAVPVPHLMSNYRKQAPATEFEWSSREEGHKARRKEILAKYPEIEKLFRPDPWAAVMCLCTVMLQISMMVFVQFYVESWLVFIALAWIIGGTCNCSLQLAMHECSHDLFFPSRWMNRWMGYVAVLTTGVPCSATFNRYHLMHHSSMGDDVTDADIPTALEAAVYRGRLGKLGFLFFQVFSYALRPGFINPLPATVHEMVGWNVAIIFDICVGMFIGRSALLYMFVSDLLGMGLHPMAGHFISEHYVYLPTKKADGGNPQPVAETGQETFSYYGCLNYLAYNVGYHNEHHDFPRVPGRFLPRVKEIAKEYYDFPYYTSWTRVLWDFIMWDHITLYSRVKRNKVLASDKKST